MTKKNEKKKILKKLEYLHSLYIIGTKGWFMDIVISLNLCKIFCGYCPATGLLAVRAAASTRSTKRPCGKISCFLIRLRALVILPGDKRRAKLISVEINKPKLR